MNISSVHLPRPVSGSGVRLAVKLTPHGPANAVLVAAPSHVHGPSGNAGGDGITTSCGWPVNARVMSCSGPRGPIFQGVWQSLQPIVFTRYSPRSMRAAGDTDAAGVTARAIAPDSAVNVTTNAIVVFRSADIRITSSPEMSTLVSPRRARR